MLILHYWNQINQKWNESDQLLCILFNKWIDDFYCKFSFVMNPSIFPRKKYLFPQKYWYLNSLHSCRICNHFRWHKKTMLKILRSEIKRNKLGWAEPHSRFPLIAPLELMSQRSIEWFNRYSTFNILRSSSFKVFEQFALFT